MSAKQSFRREDVQAFLESLIARNPATRHLMLTLAPNPRLDGIAMDVAFKIWDTAQVMTGILRDGPELSAGLRKLRESKDCFVIQGLQDCGKI